MKSKNIIITILLTAIVLGLYFVDRIYKTNYDLASAAYMVYLNGESIGLINDGDELYNLINHEQEEIRNKYQVDGVYPPDGFELVEINTYHENFTSVNDIYNQIAELDDFTIKGYTVTIKFPEEEKKEDITINVLTKEIFDKAIRNFITAFIDEKELTNYIEGTTPELTGIGQVINTMFFNETITIKEGYISVNEKIYTDVESLSQYLLFGPDAKMDSYVVELGDDIESISEEHNLNPQEFIIANPQYRNVDTMLTVGSKVNVTLLAPIITFIYEVYRIEESVTRYDTKVEVDETKDENYSEITTPGVSGITLNHENFQVKNGEQSSEIKITHYDVIREKVDQIKTVGKKKTTSGGGGYISGSYVSTDGYWGWPTNQPSVITSKYQIRWGRLHEGMDISGTGYGSPIYAIADGVVTKVAKSCSSCAQWANGNYVVVKHDNGYYSAYLHLSGFTCNVGDVVTKGQQIAKMGNSGLAYGTHLHLGLYTGGEPFAGVATQSVDPQKTIYK